MFKESRITFGAGRPPPVSLPSEGLELREDEPCSATSDDGVEDGEERSESSLELELLELESLELGNEGDGVVVPAS